MEPVAATWFTASYYERSSARGLQVWRVAITPIQIPRIPAWTICDGTRPSKTVKTKSGWPVQSPRKRDASELPLGAEWFEAAPAWKRALVNVAIGVAIVAAAILAGALGFELLLVWLP
jgi:hypothetical protein